MNRSLVSVWLLIALVLLLLPGPAGRLLLDLLGGLTLLLLIAPLVLAGLGLLAWRLLATRIRTCPSCGLSTFRSDLRICPACGWMEDTSAGADPVGQGVSRLYESNPLDVPASDVTITVQARDIDPEPPPGPN